MMDVAWRRVFAVAGKKLEGDFASEPRVPGAIDLAKRAAPDRLEDTEMPPGTRAAPAASQPRVVHPRGKHRRGMCMATMKVGQLRHKPERSEQFALGLVGAGFGSHPVDRRAVEDRPRHLRQHRVIACHRVGPTL